MDFDKIKSDSFGRSEGRLEVQKGSTSTSGGAEAILLLRKEWGKWGKV